MPSISFEVSWDNSIRNDEKPKNSIFAHKIKNQTKSTPIKSKNILFADPNLTTTMYCSRPSFHQTLYSHPMLFRVTNPSDIFDSEKANLNKRNGCKKFCNQKRSIAYDTVESDDVYKLLLDLPGVNVSDVTVDLENSNIVKIHAIRKLQNDKEIVFEQKFYVDKKVANTSGATAVLENGVLTIRKNKAKELEPVIVIVQTSNSNSGDKPVKSDEFIWSFDLPGVKSDDVQVKYHNDHVTIVATRKRGDSSVKF